MAKVSLNKLNVKKTAEPVVAELNGEQITILQYLPLNKKSEFVSKVLADIMDERNIPSMLRYEIYMSVYFVQYYTNINLTETMINNISNTYDILQLNNVFTVVLNNIPEEELSFLRTVVLDTMDVLFRYHISASGLLENSALTQNAELKDINELSEQLKTFTDNPVLQGVLEKLS